MVARCPIRLGKPKKKQYAGGIEGFSSLPACSVIPALFYVVRAGHLMCLDDYDVFVNQNEQRNRFGLTFHDIDDGVCCFEMIITMFTVG